MKLVLASFFQPENHGSGNKISISPAKPKNILDDHNYDVLIYFEHLSPGDLYYDYHKMKKSDPKAAGEIFVSEFSKKLEKFVLAARREAESQNKTVQEILPFKDGDTLLSWELKGNLSYRSSVANTLRELGYEVEEN